MSYRTHCRNCGTHYGLGLGAIDPRLKTAAFNLREVAKQLLLLEDHLAHSNKQCSDCIHKHHLCAEALAEEAVTLDGSASFPHLLPSLPNRVRGLSTGPQVRLLRKEITGQLRDRGLGSMDLAEVIMTSVVGALGVGNAFYATWSAADLAREANRIRREELNVEKATALEKIRLLKLQLEAQERGEVRTAGTTKLSIGAIVGLGVAALLLWGRR